MHGIGIGHDGVDAQVNVQGGHEDAADHALEHVPDLLFAHEGRFNVDLGEFWLTVSPQVFVAEALGDLVVAVKARHHQQLLEQLGRLWQCKKVTVVDARWHEVIACAFGGALGQHRCFDVDKTMLVQELARFHGHAVAQHQIFLHVRATQIQHAVRQASRLRQVLVVDLERRGHTGVEHFQRVRQQLNLAAGQAGVFRASRPRANQPCHLQAKLIAYVFGDFE